MKISKKDRQSLHTILEDMKNTKDFILSDMVHVCKKTTLQSNDVFMDNHGNRIVGINKHIGSGLCYLYNAINRLEGILCEL